MSVVLSMRTARLVATLVVGLQSLTANIAQLSPHHVVWLGGSEPVLVPHPVPPRWCEENFEVHLGACKQALLTIADAVGASPSEPGSCADAGVERHFQARTMRRCNSTDHPGFRGWECRGSCLGDPHDYSTCEAVLRVLPPALVEQECGCGPSCDAPPQIHVALSQSSDAAVTVLLHHREGLVHPLFLAQLVSAESGADEAQGREQMRFVVHEDASTGGRARAFDEASEAARHFCRPRRGSGEARRLYPSSEYIGQRCAEHGRSRASTLSLCEAKLLLQLRRELRRELQLPTPIRRFAHGWGGGEAPRVLVQSLRAGSAGAGGAGSGGGASVRDPEEELTRVFGSFVRVETVHYLSRMRLPRQAQLGSQVDVLVVPATLAATALAVAPFLRRHTAVVLLGPTAATAAAAWQRWGRWLCLHMSTGAGSSGLDPEAGAALLQAVHAAMRCLLLRDGRVGYLPYASIPSALVLETPARKTQLVHPDRPSQLGFSSQLAHTLDGRASRYRFSTQQTYYDSLRRSWFRVHGGHAGLGAPSLRLLETIANGCLPLSPDPHSFSPWADDWLPQRILHEIAALYGAPGTAKCGPAAAMPGEEARERLRALGNELLRHTRRRLTSAAAARHVLGVVADAFGAGDEPRAADARGGGGQHGFFRAVPRDVSRWNVLFVTPGGHADMRSDTLFLGLRELLGGRLLESTRLDWMYRSFPAANYSSMYGLCFSYCGHLLDDLPELAPSRHPDTIASLIRQHHFDVVVFGAVHRAAEGGLAHWHLVRQHYPASRVVFIDGDDHLSDKVLPQLAGRGWYFGVEMTMAQAVAATDVAWLVQHSKATIDLFPRGIKRTIGEHCGTEVAINDGAPRTLPGPLLLSDLRFWCWRGSVQPAACGQVAQAQDACLSGRGRCSYR